MDLHFDFMFQSHFVTREQRGSFMLSEKLRIVLEHLFLRNGNATCLVTAIMAIL